MATPDLSQSAAKQRTATPPPKEEAAPEIIEVTYAYLVYAKKDTGQMVLTNDLNTPVKADRAPTHDEVFGSMHVIIKDITGQQYAGMSAQASLQLNNFVASQLQGQSELDDVLRNIKGPPQAPRL